MGGNGNVGKISPKCNNIWHYGDAPWSLGVTATCFLKALFMRNICLANSMPVLNRLEVFKLTSLEKYSKSATYFAFDGSHWGATAPHYTLLKAFFRATFRLQIGLVCVYLEPLKSYKASKLTMLKNT